MSDEDDFRFRDQCAIRVLEALLTREESKTAINLMVQNCEPGSNKDWYEAGVKKMERLAQLSYKIADMMREARIASFK